MEERRRFVRLDLKVEVSYWVLTSTDPLQTETTNMSGGGLCLMLNEPLPPRTPLAIEVRLPNRDRPVTCVGEVVWCEWVPPKGDVPPHRSVEIGVQFLKIDPEDHEALLHYVRSELSPKSPVES